MDKLRRYRADYVFTEEATGVGIVEYSDMWDAETLAIQSVYIDRRISNRDASLAVFETIYNQLVDNEQALLQMGKYTYAKGWDQPFRNRLITQFTSQSRGQVFQARLLAEDAIRRGYDITKYFNEAMSFSAMKQQKEERLHDR